MAVIHGLNIHTTRRHVTGDRIAPLPCWFRDPAGQYARRQGFTQQQGFDGSRTGAVNTNHSTKSLIHLPTRAIGATYKDHLK